MEVELRQVIKAALEDIPVNWGWPPEGQKMPHVTLVSGSASRTYSHDAPDQIMYRRVQVDVWAAKEAEAAAIRDKIIASTDGARFTEGKLRSVFIEDEEYEAGKDVDNPYHRYIIDLQVWFEK